MLIRRALLVVAISIAATTLLAACGSVKKTGKTDTFDVTVANGKPQGGVQKWKVHLGDNVKLTVHSDTADEVHIHGYDLHKDVSKGGQVSFSFFADQGGEYETELENAKQTLGHFEVS